jgi:hypothetical protein
MFFCVTVVWGTKILLLLIEAFLKSTIPAVILLFNMCIFEIREIKGSQTNQSAQGA